MRDAARDLLFRMAQALGRDGGQSVPMPKQPFTKINFSWRGNTISGFPGKSRRWILNRNPIR